jgi:sodium transport system permease protein
MPTNGTRERRMMRDAWIVIRKELLDALRDRRTLLMVLLSSVAMGPLVLVLLSTLVSGIEKRAEAREVMVVGQAHAPTLVNYLLRQTYTHEGRARGLGASAAGQQAR